MYSRRTVIFDWTEFEKKIFFLSFFLKLLFLSLSLSLCVCIAIIIRSHTHMPEQKLKKKKKKKNGVRYYIRSLSLFLIR